MDNLSFAKRVGVRLSSDGGVTWNDTLAGFTGAATEGTFASSSGVEIWAFKTPEFNLNTATPNFEFALFCQNPAAGETFWDNAFGNNYQRRFGQN